MTTITITTTTSTTPLAFNADAYARNEHLIELQNHDDGMTTVATFPTDTVTDITLAGHHGHVIVALGPDTDVTFCLTPVDEISINDDGWLQITRGDRVIRQFPDVAWKHATRYDTARNNVQEWTK